MTTYQIEYSRSSRAGCKGTCKSNIEKGALRLGSISSGDGFDRTYWKHFPDCCTDRVLANVLGAVGDPTQIPGYSELEPKDQALVKSTFINHEAKETAKDNGEGEGRPAKKARKTPTKKEQKAKQDKEATEALLEGEESDDEGSNEEEEKKKAPKKTKAAAAKKGKSPKSKSNGETKTKKKASSKATKAKKEASAK